MKAFLEVLPNRFLLTSHWPELDHMVYPKKQGYIQEVIFSKIYVAAPSKIEVLLVGTNPYVNGL